MLARSKLNSIESKISEALINNEISHEDYTTIINEENLKKALEWWKLKELILKKVIWLKKVKEKALIKLLGKMHKYKTVLSYCLKCRKNTENINPKTSRTINGKTMILSNCATCGSKKSKFIKKQEANELFSTLRIKTPLSRIPLLGNVLFWKQFYWII